MTMGSVKTKNFTLQGETPSGNIDHLSDYNMTVKNNTFVIQRIRKEPFPMNDTLLSVEPTHSNNHSSIEQPHEESSEIIFNKEVIYEKSVVYNDDIVSRGQLYDINNTFTKDMEQLEYYENYWSERTGHGTQHPARSVYMIHGPYNNQYIKHYGEAKEIKDNTGKEPIFPLYSTTKPMCALSLLSQYADTDIPAFNITDPIKNFIPCASKDILNVQKLGLKFSDVNELGFMTTDVPITHNNISLFDGNLDNHLPMGVFEIANDNYVYNTANPYPYSYTVRVGAGNLGETDRPTGYDKQMVFRIVPIETEITIKHCLAHQAGFAYPFLGTAPATWLNNPNTYKSLALYSGIAKSYWDAVAASKGLYAGDPPSSEIGPRHDLAQFYTLDSLKMQLNTPLVFQPGTDFSYSMSYDTISCIVQINESLNRGLISSYAEFNYGGEDDYTIPLGYTINGTSDGNKDIPVTLEDVFWTRLSDPLGIDRDDFFMVADRSSANFHNQVARHIPSYTFTYAETMADYYDPSFLNELSEDDPNYATRQFAKSVVYKVFGDTSKYPTPEAFLRDSKRWWQVGAYLYLFYEPVYGAAVAASLANNSFQIDNILAEDIPNLKGADGEPLGLPAGLLSGSVYTPPTKSQYKFYIGGSGLKGTAEAAVKIMNCFANGGIIQDGPNKGNRLMPSWAIRLSQTPLYRSEEDLLKIYKYYNASGFPTNSGRLTYCLGWTMTIERDGETEINLLAGENNFSHGGFQGTVLSFSPLNGSSAVFGNNNGGMSYTLGTSLHTPFAPGYFSTMIEETKVNKFLFD